MACEVAATEPAIVFPVLPFTAKTECKIDPGGVVTHDRVMFDLLENICDEIARNGLDKIIMFTGHGGPLAPYLYADGWVFPTAKLSYDSVFPFTSNSPRQRSAGN